MHRECYRVDGVLGHKKAQETWRLESCIACPPKLEQKSVIKISVKCTVKGASSSLFPCAGDLNNMVLNNPWALSKSPGTINIFLKTKEGNSFSSCFMLSGFPQTRTRWRSKGKDNCHCCSPGHTHSIWKGLHIFTKWNLSQQCMVSWTYENSVTDDNQCRRNTPDKT